MKDLFQKRFATIYGLKVTAHENKPFVAVVSSGVARVKGVRFAVENDVEIELDASSDYVVYVNIIGEVTASKNINVDYDALYIPTLATIKVGNTSIFSVTDLRSNTNYREYVKVNFQDNRDLTSFDLNEVQDIQSDMRKGIFDSIVRQGGILKGLKATAFTGIYYADYDNQIDQKIEYRVTLIDRDGIESLPVVATTPEGDEYFALTGEGEEGKVRFGCRLLFDHVGNADGYYIYTRLYGEATWKKLQLDIDDTDEYLLPYTNTITIESEEYVYFEDDGAYESVSASLPITTTSSLEMGDVTIYISENKNIIELTGGTFYFNGKANDIKYISIDDENYLRYDKHTVIGTDMVYVRYATYNVSYNSDTPDTGLKAEYTLEPSADREELRLSFESEVLDNSSETDLIDEFYIPIYFFYRDSGILEPSVTPTLNLDINNTYGNLEEGRYPHDHFIEDLLAKRTSNESGNYLVDGLNLKFEENSFQTDGLVGTLTGGQGYVKGYNIKFDESQNVRLSFVRTSTLVSDETHSLDPLYIHTYDSASGDAVLPYTLTKLANNKSVLQLTTSRGSISSDSLWHVPNRFEDRWILFPLFKKQTSDTSDKGNLFYIEDHYVNGDKYCLLIDGDAVNQLPTNLQTVGKTLNETFLIYDYDALTINTLNKPIQDVEEINSIVATNALVSRVVSSPDKDRITDVNTGENFTFISIYEISQIDGSGNKTIFSSDNYTLTSNQYVSWDGSTKPTAGTSYNVYGFAVKSLEKDRDFVILDNLLPENQNYYYKVAPFNAEHTSSLYAGEGKVTNAIKITKKQRDSVIKLTWGKAPYVDTSSDGYVIYRSIDGTNFYKLVQTYGTDRVFYDDGQAKPSNVPPVQLEAASINVPANTLCAVEEDNNSIFLYPNESNGSLTPMSGNNVIQLSYYVKNKRIDVVYLTKDKFGRENYKKGKIGIIVGEESFQPKTPSIPADVLPLHIVRLIGQKTLPIVESFNLYRMTFKDLRKLEKRVDRIEENVLRLALENEAIGKEDGAKVGVLAEPFADLKYLDQGYSTYDANEEIQSAYHARINLTKNFATVPRTNQPFILEVDKDNSSNIKFHTDVASLDYEEEVSIEQLDYSETLNINPFNDFTPSFLYTTQKKYKTKPLEVVNLAANGGYAPYVWTLDGAGSINIANSNKCEFTAPYEEDDFEENSTISRVICKDAVGQILIFTITTTINPVTLTVRKVVSDEYTKLEYVESPANKLTRNDNIKYKNIKGWLKKTDVKPGESFEVIAKGGTGVFDWSIPSEFSVISTETDYVRKYKFQRKLIKANEIISPIYSSITEKEISVSDSNTGWHDDCEDSVDVAVDNTRIKVYSSFEGGDTIYTHMSKQRRTMVELHAIGGTEEYTWTATSGTLEDSNENVISETSGREIINFIPDNSEGTVTIKCADANNSNNYISINLVIEFQSLRIKRQAHATKDNPYVDGGTNYQISAVGGNGTYSWSPSNANVTFSDSSSIDFDYATDEGTQSLGYASFDCDASGAGIGTCTLTCSDTLGNYDTVVINIEPNPVSSQTELVVDGGSNIDLKNVITHKIVEGFEADSEKEYIIYDNAAIPAALDTSVGVVHDGDFTLADTTVGALNGWSIKLGGTSETTQHEIGNFILAVEQAPKTEALVHIDVGYEVPVTITSSSANGNVLFADNNENEMIVIDDEEVAETAYLFRKGLLLVASGGTGKYEWINPEPTKIDLSFPVQLNRFENNDTLKKYVIVTPKSSEDLDGITLTCYDNFNSAVNYDSSIDNHPSFSKYKVILKETPISIDSSPALDDAAVMPLAQITLNAIGGNGTYEWSISGSSGTINSYSGKTIVFTANSTAGDCIIRCQNPDNTTNYSTATIHVKSPELSIIPKLNTIQPGTSATFTALGASNISIRPSTDTLTAQPTSALTWSASEGTIVSSGLTTALWSPEDFDKNNYLVEITLTETIGATIKTATALLMISGSSIQRPTIALHPNQSPYTFNFSHAGQLLEVGSSIDQQLIDDIHQNIYGGGNNG